MKRLFLIAPTIAGLTLGLTLGSGSAVAQQAAANSNRVPSADMKAIPNPIAAVNSVWMEELTVVEIRDAMRKGMTTALIVTGGVEDNGPYTSIDKHNVMWRATGESIARRLGNALVAPVIAIHQGNPTTQDLPGSIVLTPETFRAVMKDYATSLKTQGFKNIFIMGEDGGAQGHMDTVAKELTAEWGAASSAKVAYIPEYYREDPWSCNLLRKELNIQQQPLDYCSGGGGVIYHDDYHYSAILATVAPDRIRVQQRRDAGLFSVNSVNLDPLDKTILTGWKLIDYRTDITVRAIQKAMGAASQ
jgi:hypothetical protein